VSAKTTIEWAANADGSPGATWNPIRARDRETGKVGTFCVHTSDGCKFCYAEKFQGRGLPNNGIGLAYAAQNLPKVEHYLDEKMLSAPLRIRKSTTFFLSSMTDIFGDWVSEEILAKLFVTMAARPDHLFIVVTKRSARMRKALAMGGQIDLLLRTFGGGLPLRNVWLVVSTEDQPNYDERTEDLRATPAIIRGVSAEPLIGPIKADLRGIDWVIVGGESGPGARLMRPEWAQSLRDQCAAAGVPFFFKQWGAWAPWPHWPEDRTEATAPIMEMRRVGKLKGGRLLDGREHNERPAFSHLERAAA
jgi:protein gp37